MPIEFMGIRGRFLLIAAMCAAGGFIGYMAMALVLGQLAGFITMAAIILSGLITIYIKQRKGLHSKRIDKEIVVYNSLFEH